MLTITDIGTLITRSTDQGNSLAMIAGTRVSVGRIVVLYKQGAEAVEIARRISHLNLAQVYAALTYYHINRDEIEIELAESDSEYWQLAKLHSPKVEMIYK